MPLLREAVVPVALTSALLNAMALKVMAAITAAPPQNVLKMQWSLPRICLIIKPRA